MTTLNEIIENADKIKELASQLGFNNVHTFWDKSDYNARTRPIVKLVVNRVEGTQSFILDAFDLAVTLEREFNCEFEVIIADNLTFNGKIMTGFKIPIQEKDTLEAFFAPRSLEGIQLRTLNMDKHNLEYSLFHDNKNVERNTELYKKMYNCYINKLKSRKYTAYYGDESRNIIPISTDNDVKKSVFSENANGQLDMLVAYSPAATAGNGTKRALDEHTQIPPDEEKELNKKTKLSKAQNYL